MGVFLCLGLPIAAGKLFPESIISLTVSPALISTSPHLGLKQALSFPTHFCRDLGMMWPGYVDDPHISVSREELCKNTKGMKEGH